MQRTIKTVLFNLNGFRSMTLGRTLWAIIIIELYVMFAVLRPSFFRLAVK